MRLFLIIAYTAGVAVALPEKDDLWSSGSLLQARQNRVFPLQQRGSYVDLSPRSLALQRRADRPGRSGSSRNQGSSGRQGSPAIPDSFAGQASPRTQSPNRPSRPRSPTIRSSAFAQGPATLKVGGQDVRTKDVLHYQADILHDQHPHYSVASAASRRSALTGGESPPRQRVQAGAKGQSVLGIVKPGFGGEGHIRIETPEGVKETTVRNPIGEYKADGTDLPGGSRVIAKSTRGGEATAIAMDQDTTPRP